MTADVLPIFLQLHQYTTHTNDKSNYYHGEHGEKEEPSESITVQNTLLQIKKLRGTDIWARGDTSLIIVILNAYHGPITNPKTA